jgi:CheY-like chemotaxis protein
LQTKKNRVLVIDDDQSVREVTAFILRSRGLEAIEAETGEKGIDLARTANPDLILSDIRMPNMDGFAVLDCLQMDPETANIPFIFMTGWADSVEVSNQLKRGVRFIWKPFNVEMLMHSVLAHLTSPDAGRNSQMAISLVS